MGNEQSLLKQHGYTLVEEVGQTYFMRTARVKDDKTKKQHIAKEIRINNVPRNLQEEILAEVDILTNMRHPNILKCKETLKDRDTLYVVMEYCEGGELSQKITRQRETGEQFSEDQVLDWFVQICMALQYLHEHSILHKDLKPQNIFFTKAGVIRLDTSGIPRGLDSTLPTSELQLQHYTPLEILRGNPHNEKSDVWSLGCVLYELCMLEPAFSAFSENDLIARLQRGPAPLMSDRSLDLHDLGNDLLQTFEANRPSVNDILWKPFILRFLAKKFRTTVEELQQKVNELKDILDQMERMHYKTTAVSLGGGVMGATGGIMCITGLILAPFTLGASLIVTGVGVGLATAGGATGAASNITNTVKQFIDRRSIQNILDEVQDKMDSCVACLQTIDDVSRAPTANQSISDGEPMSTGRGLGQAGVRVSRSFAGVSELTRLVNVINIGRVAAQAARTVRVAEAVTGVLAGVFVALDIYFISTDAREIHAMRQEGSTRTSGSSRKSETRKFIQKMREASDELQMCVTELNTISTYFREI